MPPKKKNNGFLNTNKPTQNTTKNLKKTKNITSDQNSSQINLSENWPPKCGNSYYKNGFENCKTKKNPKQAPIKLKTTKNIKSDWNSSQINFHHKTDPHPNVTIQVPKMGSKIEMN